MITILNTLLQLSTKDFFTGFLAPAALVVLTWALTKMVEKSKRDAEIRKLIGDADHLNIEDNLMLMGKIAEQDKALRDLRIALEKAEEANKRLTVAFNLYKNFHVKKE